MKLLICSVFAMVAVACATSPSDDPGAAVDRREDPDALTFWQCANNTNGECISVVNIGSHARQDCLTFCAAAGAVTPRCFFTAIEGCGQ